MDPLVIPFRFHIYTATAVSTLLQGVHHRRVAFTSKEAVALAKKKKPTLIASGRCVLVFHTKLRTAMLSYSPARNTIVECGALSCIIGGAVVLAGS